MGDQWDACTLAESRNVWLPLEVDEEKRSVKLLWYDVYDLNVKTGEWKSIEGQTYYSKDAKIFGDVFLQEANFASYGVIATGIYGNESTITFTVDGDGEDQLVSFYHQNTDDMGFGDQPMGQPDRIGGTWQLRRISSVIVNEDADKIYKLYQRDTHKATILSTAVKLPLKRGKNTVKVGGLHNGTDYRGADLDRIIVYPPEEKTVPVEDAKDL